MNKSRNPASTPDPISHAPHPTGEQQHAEQNLSNVPERDHNVPERDHLRITMKLMHAGPTTRYVKRGVNRRGRSDWFGH